VKIHLDFGFGASVCEPTRLKSDGFLMTEDALAVTCKRCRSSVWMEDECAKLGVAYPPPMPEPVDVNPFRGNLEAEIVARLQGGRKTSRELATALHVTSRRIRQVCNASGVVVRLNGFQARRLAVWGLDAK